jgi:hypothetical protein
MRRCANCEHYESEHDDRGCMWTDPWGYGDDCHCPGFKEPEGKAGEKS